VDEITAPLAQYAASLRFEELPEAIVTRAVTLLIDTLACAVGGFDSPQAAIGRRLAETATPARYRGRLLGRRAFSTAELAAFANSAAIRYLEFNDTFPGGHPSDCAGAMLALAEHSEADGKHFLMSLVAAYEAFASLIGPLSGGKGWGQGLATALATVAGLGSLLHLTEPAIGHALAITAASTVSLGVATTGEISQWKGAATAFAVRNAVLATLLAAEGTTGPDAPFSGHRGVWDQVSGPFTLAKLGGRGGDFRLPLVRTKYWPVQYESQAAVWAAATLREQVSEADVEAIAIVTSGRGWQEQSPEKWDPRTRETADHSIPYVFARAFRDGRIDLRSFEDAAVLDSRLRPFMSKMTVRHEGAGAAGDPSRVEVRVTLHGDGAAQRVVTEQDPLGHERNPMSHAQVTDKFRALAAPLLGPTRAEQALVLWSGVATESSLAPLLDSLVVK
jgi:2-methylcitrate dehydratase